MRFLNLLSCLLLLCPINSFAQTYDPDSRLIFLPTLVVANTTYSDVQAKLADIEVVSIGTPALSATTYDVATKLLSLPTISVSGTTYANVLVRLGTVEVMQIGATTTSPPSPSRIFVNLVSHNEDTSTGGNADCQAFFSSADTLYSSNSLALEAIVQTVASKGASFSFQTDVEYLNLVLAKESAQSNILRRLISAYPGYLDIDAHAHESVNKNYADVANLVERVSGVRNGVVGGFTSVVCRPNSTPPDWDKFRQALAPASGLGTSFSASILTLGVSAGHVCDPDASGIWRPATTDNFFADDPNQELITIGTGYAANGLTEAITAIERLVNDLKAGLLESNRMYTASITIPQCNMHLGDSGVTAADVSNFIDAVNALDDSTDIIRWATFSRMAETWRSEYAKQPSLWRGQ